MNNQDLISLEEELKYTKLSENIEKLYTFITSDLSADISEYHKVLLETQLNAMNIYRNALVLRISNLTLLNNQNNESKSN